MSLSPRLSAVLIARNERDNVRDCFARFWDQVDEVVIADTGSDDGTIAEARRFAMERGEKSKLVVGRFRWCEDFSAARNHAHGLASGDVHLTIDLDERLVGSEHLRELAELFVEKPDVSTILAIVTEPGLMNQQNWRATLLRAPVRWAGRVMEGPQCRGEEMLWTHRASVTHQRAVHHGRRDLDIALDWAIEEPDQWQPLLAAAEEAAELEEWGVVIERCDLGLKHAGVPDQQRAHLLLLAAHAAEALGDHESVGRLLYLSAQVSPAAETWLLAGRYALDQSTFEEALNFARLAVQLATSEDIVEQAVSLAVDAVVKRDGDPDAGVEQRRECALWPRSDVLSSTW